MGQDIDNALTTLFYPFETGALTYSSLGSAIAFFNARDCAALNSFPADKVFIQQYFKPYAQELEEGGFKISSEIPNSAEMFDSIFILIPKNQIEAAALLAAGLKALKTGGLLVAAGDNKAGGARLTKMLQAFGCKNIRGESKNKARVVWIYKEALSPQIDAAMKAGAPQEIIGDFYSWPGLFGWDKIDHGSKILAQYLPQDLSGHGADFGCGYGYLARAVLAHDNVQSLACIDADYRAVLMCRRNLESVAAIQLKFFWEDLTQVCASVRDLDFIVMNPPFHEGKAQDVKIGAGFIQTAQQALQPGGMLWMVANVRLPYEDVLRSHFQKCEKKFEGTGFKVFAAQK